MLSSVCDVNHRAGETFRLLDCRKGRRMSHTVENAVLLVDILYVNGAQFTSFRFSLPL